MARLKLEFPEDQFCFSTQLTVRVTDINAANHLGNDSMISMISEAHARDQLLFEVGVMDFNKYGGDITFHVTRPQDGKLIAMAKQGFVFYNYKHGQVVPMPDDFRAKFPRVN